MANEDHLEILKQGVEAWNQWRKENPEVRPDLRNAPLQGTTLSKANLSDVDLSGAMLIDADLTSADLTGADLDSSLLIGAKLTCAEVSSARFRGADLRGITAFSATLSNSFFVGANLSMANLTASKLVQAHLDRVSLEDAWLLNAVLEGASLTHANLLGANLAGVKASNADFTNSNLCGSRMINSTLDTANLTGCHLWATQREDWSIKGVICEFAFWDKEGEKRTDYEPGAFERLHSEGVRVELLYDGGINAAEISSLPFLLRHLEEAHEGCTLRLKSVEDAPGGARVIFIVGEAGGTDENTLKTQLEEEGRKLQGAIRALLGERQSKKQLEEDYARFRERVLPFLLQAAERTMLPSNPKAFQAAVLFSDLAGFSKLGDDNRAGTLQLLRGILKPILDYWHGDYPNMWGDALRVTFEEVNDALECACRAQTTVAAQGLTQRIGMDHGEINAKFNPTIDGMDIEGGAVNMAARLEPIAGEGEVLISEGLRYHPDVDEQRFEFSQTKRKLKKGVGDKPKGNEETCYVVTLRS